MFGFSGPSASNSLGNTIERQPAERPLHRRPSPTGPALRLGNEEEVPRRPTPESRILGACDKTQRWPMPSHWPFAASAAMVPPPDGASVTGRHIGRRPCLYRVLITPARTTLLWKGPTQEQQQNCTRRVRPGPTSRQPSSAPRFLLPGVTARPTCSPLPPWDCQNTRSQRQRARGGAKLITTPF